MGTDGVGSRRMDSPRPGYYLTERQYAHGEERPRLVKDRDMVPARIWLSCPMCPEGFPLDRSRRLMAEIDGRPVDPYVLWTRRLYPTTETEFDLRRAGFGPPKQVKDLNALPPIY